jgi:hypothetical protein
MSALLQHRDHLINFPRGRAGQFGPLLLCERIENS